MQNGGVHIPQRSGFLGLVDRSQQVFLEKLVLLRLTIRSGSSVYSLQMPGMQPVFAIFSHFLQQLLNIRNPCVGVLVQILRFRDSFAVNRIESLALAGVGFVTRRDFSRLLCRLLCRLYPAWFWVW